MTPEEIETIIQKHRYPTLHAGQTGINVITLQIWLQMLGFYQGPISGRLDAPTAQAVEAFRADQNVKGTPLKAPPDAVLERDTWEVMDNLLQQRLPPDPATLDRPPFPRRSSYDSEAKYHKALYEGLRAFGFPVKPAQAPIRFPLVINERGVCILHGLPPGSYSLELGDAGSPGRGSAELHLEDGGGAPFSGQIRLVRDGAAQSVTVASGHALVNGLEPGDYQVVVEKVDEANQIVANTGSVEIRLVDANNQPVGGTATLIGETGDVASLQQAVRLFQALSRKVYRGLEPGDRSGLGNNILTGEFAETAHDHHELAWDNFDYTWGRFHGAPWMGVVFHPLDRGEAGREQEELNWGERETVAMLYEWGEVYLNASHDERDLKERLRRPIAIRYIARPLGGRMDERADFSQAGTAASLYLPRISEKVIEGVATGQTYGGIDYDSGGYSTIHMETQLAVLASLPSDFVARCPDGDLIGRLKLSTPMPLQISLLEDRYARNRSINATRSKKEEAPCITLGEEWAACKLRLKRIAKKNEEKEEIQEYHEGVQAKLEDAFEEFEEEASKVKTLTEPAENRKLCVRLKALFWALKQASYADNKNKELRRLAERYQLYKTSEQLTNSVTVTPSTNKNHNYYKCNKFVMDAYAHGAKVGLSTEKGRKGIHADMDEHGNTWGPVANDFARVGGNLRSLTNAEDVTKNAQPRPGDVVAYSSEYEDSEHEMGHVSIYVGAGLVVSAKGDEGATVETMAFERKDHNGIARVRQWTGSGK